MTISVKRATIENAKDVAKLFNDYRVYYEQATDSDLALSFISERIKNQESVIFLASNDNEGAVGFTQLYPTFSSVSAKQSWILNDLFVSSSARRLGAARALMDTALEFASSTGASSIALETSKDNLNAQALYEKLGFIKDNDFYHYARGLTPPS